MTEVDRMAVIERWTITACPVCMRTGQISECHSTVPGQEHHAKAVEVGVVPLTTHRGAVEALREIVALDDREGDMGEGPGYWGAIGECAEIARRALGGQ